MLVDIAPVDMGFACVEDVQSGKTLKNHSVNRPNSGAHMKIGFVGADIIGAPMADHDLSAQNRSMLADRAMPSAIDGVANHRFGDRP